MGRHSTLPTLYDECKTVSMIFLKKHGYLRPKHWMPGTITWSRNGVQTSSIGIAVSTCEQPYIEFNYICNDKSIRYQVRLISLPSNLGKGEVWFFVCPNTGKLCRKLYLISGHFLHRDAFKGCMYEKQTYSKQNRDQFRIWGKVFGRGGAYEQMYSKHFKKYYKGKPTKRYAKLMKYLNEASNVSEESLLARHSRRCR